MKTYYEVNGVKFSDAKAAEKYEKELEKADKRKKELDAQKEKRLNELKEAKDKYFRLLDAYNKDYRNDNDFLFWNILF